MVCGALLSHLGDHSNVYDLVHIGAGISVQAGIPDFRSSDGLFQRIKRENPKDNLSSGKDLFDASVFSVGARIIRT